MTCSVLMLFLLTLSQLDLIIHLLSGSPYQTFVLHATISLCTIRVFFYKSVWLYTTNALKFALTSGPTGEKRHGFIFVPCEQPKHSKWAGGEETGWELGEGRRYYEHISVLLCGEVNDSAQT